MTTSRAASWLRSINEHDARALIDAVAAAHGQLPTLAPGVRPVLSGLLWRLETAGYSVNFADMEGRPVIVTGRLSAAPKPRRKGKAA